MKKISKAFTMAEILISLTIIGILAAIMYPALMGNINERTWNTKRKALHNRLTQALSLLPTINGYGAFSGTFVYEEEDDDGNITPAHYETTLDTAAAAFVSNGLSTVLKLDNICTAENASNAEEIRDEMNKCGIPSRVVSIKNERIDFPTSFFEVNRTANIDTRAAAFETKNGESVAVFYNPYCNSSMHRGVESVGRLVCINFIYDLNGTRGPNTFGKDVGFMSAFSTNSEVSLVAPIPDGAALKSTYNEQLGWLAPTPTACRERNIDSRVPSPEEMVALAFNSNFLDFNDGGGMYITNNAKSFDWTNAAETGYYVRMNNYRGTILGSIPSVGSGTALQCIKKY